MNSKNYIFLITYLCLTAIGILLIMLGIKGNVTPFFKHLLPSIGGVLLGTNITMIIESLRKINENEKIIRIISNSLNSKIISDEKLIMPFRKKFFCYYNTEDENGVLYWNHILVDFTNNQGPGQLVTRVKLLNEFGKKYTYTFEGLMRYINEPLVIFDKPETGNEEPGIHIFPSPKKYKAQLYGFSYLETWTGKTMIGKIILCEDPLFGIRNPGRIENGDISSKLDIEYKTKFLEKLIVFDKIG